MICTPETSIRRWGRSGLLALALASLLSLAPASLDAQEATGAQSALKEGREALQRGDAVAAEVALKRSLDGGMPESSVAALLGEAYLLAGENDEARRWLEPGAFDPASRQHGFHMLARLEMAEGNLSASMVAFEKALDGKKGTADIWVDMGRLRYRAGEHHQALEAAAEALQIDPNHPRALEFRGQLARDGEGLIASLPWLERGIEAAPEDLSLLGEYAATLGEIGRATDMLRVTRKMLELDGENPRAFFLQAVLAARAGNNTLARRLLWRTKGSFEEMPAAILLEGVLELRAGNWALAVESLDRLARRQPANERAALLLARAMLENGDASEIVARYSEVAQRADTSPYMLALVGRAYEQIGNREAAANLLDRAAADPFAAVRALPVGPDGELVMFRFGSDPYRIDAAVPRVRQELAGGNTAAAATVVAPLLERYPGSADVEVLAGDVALARGDALKALEYYRSSALIRRSFALVRRMVAAHQMRGQENEGRGLVSAFLAQHPQDAEAAEYLGYLCASAHQWGRAEALLSYAETLRGGRSSDPRLLATLSEAALRRGDEQRALELGEAAFEAQRTNRHAVTAFARALDAMGRNSEARALADKARRLPVG